MTPVSFVKTMESSRFADWVTIWVVHLPEQTVMGLITTEDPRYSDTVCFQRFCC